MSRSKHVILIMFPCFSLAVAAATVVILRSEDASREHHHIQQAEGRHHKCSHQDQLAIGPETCGAAQHWVPNKSTKTGSNWVRPNSPRWPSIRRFTAKDHFAEKLLVGPDPQKRKDAAHSAQDLGGAPGHLLCSPGDGLVLLGLQGRSYRPHGDLRDSWSMTWASAIPFDPPSPSFSVVEKVGEMRTSWINLLRLQDSWVNQSSWKRATRSWVAALCYAEGSLLRVCVEVESSSADRCIETRVKYLGRTGTDGATSAKRSPSPMVTQTARNEPGILEIWTLI